MILDETKLASTLIDGDEEATPAEGDEAPSAQLDGEEEEAAPAEGGDESSESTEGGDM